MAGADVLTQTPEIRAWLLSLAPDKQMVVGSYIYLDGCASLHGLRLRLRLALRLRLGSYICLDGCARVRFGLTLPSSYPHGPGVPRTVNRSFICAESSAWRTDSKCSESPARSNLWTDPFHSTPALTRHSRQCIVVCGIHARGAHVPAFSTAPTPRTARVYQGEARAGGSGHGRHRGGRVQQEEGHGARLPGVARHLLPHPRGGGARRCGPSGCAPVESLRGLYYGPRQTWNPRAWFEST